MDVVFVNYFIESTLHVLETTASVDVKRKKAFVKKGQAAYGDISGVLKFAGDVNGSAAISFDKEAILSIVSIMFGEEMKQLDDEIKDAVGEVINMVSGQVSMKFTQDGKQVKVELSEIIMGEGQVIVHAYDLPVLSIPFNTGTGRFIIELCCE